jgi:hypothetical protein
MSEDMTMADHAEAWWGEQGNILPDRGTKEWRDMYKKWHTYAFEDFASAGE